MADNYLERFEFSYENSASGCFLVINASADERILPYQIEMLKNNPNKNILPVSLMQKDSKYQLRYNITSRLSLSQYLNRNRLKRDEFINIFSDIAKAILDSKEYLLSDKSFIINKNYIFINPNSIEASLVYLPINFDININDILKNFTIDFIMYGTNIYETKGDDFIQRILYLLKSDTFNILEFRNLLNELKVNKTSGKSNNYHLPVNEAFNDKDRTQVSPLKSPTIKGSETVEQNTEKSKIQKQKEVKPEIKKVEKSKDERSKVRIPRPEIPRLDVSKKDVKESKVSKRRENPRGSNINPNTGIKKIIKITYKPKAIVLASVLQGIILILSIVMLTSGVMDSLGNDLAINIIGIGILAGAASYLVWRALLVEKNKVESVSSTKERPVFEKPKIDVKPKDTVPLQGVNKNVLEDNVVQQSKKNHLKGINSFEAMNKTVLLSSGNLNETTVLSSKNKVYPYLEGKNNGALEKIIINKPSFIIGRLIGQVDYISKNNAVGKMHAEIISRNGYYYLKDFNSRNGTFVNGKRLTSNMEYKIKNDDKITFANSEYIFIVP